MARSKALQLSIRREALAVGLFSSGAALALGLMIGHALWLRSVGAICGNHAANQHCAGCYIAAAMMIAGVTLALGAGRSAPIRP